MYKLAFLLMFCSILTVCDAQNCKSIPSVFNSYEQAKQIVTAASFPFRQTIMTTKSSWIREATYYSCDGKTGFFLFKTNNQTYIHQDVPLTIWKGFVAADSYGSFYDHYLKHKFPLKLVGK
ncbi:KTSC domain-containing protein [Chitinophagaceae bacterium 26-R-25]|nr:KTSC domain-containing protein [Chitinophagaceae bacterium 26-R-25]